MRLFKRKELLLILVLLLGVSFLLSACESNVNARDDRLNIGIIQFGQHPALDHAREGFIEEIEDLDIDINIIYKNAQSDMSNVNTITQKMVQDDVDLIYAIATPVAQSVKNIVKDIPVVFTAVTDSVEAGIIDNIHSPEGNITGTCDTPPLEEQFKLLKELDKDIKNIGILFNTSELNSQVQVEQAKLIAKKFDFNIVDMGVNNITDITKSMDVLLNKVDAIYTPADNMIASSINIIADKANKSNIITIASEEAHVENGILITKGISYRDLGMQSATMAKKILLEDTKISDIPIGFPDKLNITINKDTLNHLDLNMDKEILDNAKIIK